MSTPRDRDQLKTYLQTGDRPTQSQLWDLVDGMVNQESDNFHITDNQDVGIGTDNPNSKLHIVGNTFITTDQTEKNRKTGNALEIYAGAAHGIAITTEGNDVFNFFDDSTSKVNPFTFVDHAQRGFRFYNSDHGEQLRIAKNNNVGVGPIWNDASARLQVNGPSADEDQPGILRIEATGGNQNSANLRLGVMKDDYSWIQSHGSKPLHINKIGNNTLLNTNAGNVGIGVNDPKNKLHLHNGDDLIPLQQSTGHTGGGVAGKSSAPMVANDTGLRLSTGSANGRILVSDNDGNAYWQEPTVVTNGLWKDIGNTGHIENGNPGNVGIGTNNPQSALHVNGDIRLNDDSIYLRGGQDKNHGIGWFGAQNSNKAFGGTYNFDGPVIFGHTGGGLGSVNNSNIAAGKVAMTWKHDQSVDFKGNVNVNGGFNINGSPPILMRRFTNNVQMNSHQISVTWNGMTPTTTVTIAGFDTGIPTSVYISAAITGHASGDSISQFTTSWYDANGPIAGSHDHTVDVKTRQYIFVFRKNGTWHVAADIFSDGTNEGWRVDVMFIQTGMVQLNSSDNWDLPLNDQ